MKTGVIQLRNFLLGLALMHTIGSMYLIVRGYFLFPLLMVLLAWIYWDCWRFMCKIIRESAGKEPK